MTCTDTTMILVYKTLTSALRILERDFPNGQLVIDTRKAIALLDEGKPGTERHGPALSPPSASLKDDKPKEFWTRGL